MKNKTLKKVFISIFIILINFCLIGCQNRSTKITPWTKSVLLFEDSGTINWKANWMLDGERAKIFNTKEGMEFIAGQEYGNDSCHAVLWTKQRFQGNICIEYDYTRTDTTTRCVNILYFHATGKGNADFPVDIALWNNKRVVPHMHTYFNNMHAYHISYAAFSAKEYSPNDDYIRLRRYNPMKKGLKGTDVPGDYFKTGLFKPGITYHIQVFKYNNQIEMHINNNQNASDFLICKWDVSMFPDCVSGRIGLRHMFTRGARYKNFKVWKLE